jgi:hypothetical protein
MSVRAEAAKLLAVLGGDDEELADMISIDRAFLVDLLEIDSEFPLGDHSVGRFVLQAFESLTVLADGEERDHALSQLAGLVEPTERSAPVGTRAAAAKVLAHVNPRRFLAELGRHLSASATGQLFAPAGASQVLVNVSRLTPAIEIALDSLEGDYYGGDMCPGYLNSFEDDPERLAEEYDEMSSLWGPILLRTEPDLHQRVRKFLRSFEARN